VRSHRWGYLIMFISFSIGFFYIFSLILWLKYEIMTSTFWWTWWIIIIPVSSIVFFLVFFTAWIGWVISKSTGEKKKELLKTK